MHVMKKIVGIGSFLAATMFFSFAGSAFGQSADDGMPDGSYFDGNRSSIFIYGLPEHECPSCEIEDPRDWNPLYTNVFLDGFYMMDWNRPADPGANSTITHHGHDLTQGFSLAFAGLDVSYRKDVAGLTLGLRFGEGASRYTQDNDPVLAAVKQAYGTWYAADRFRLDVGQFDSVFGGEVTDSWLNPNYSRGALDNMQPLYHTGVRGVWGYQGYLALTGLVVNGSNARPVDGEQSPHLGLQLRLTPNPDVAVDLGYYTGAQSSGFGQILEPTGDTDPRMSETGWEHMVDLVVKYELGDLFFVGNGSWLRSGQRESECVVFNKQQVCGAPVLWGGSLSAAYNVGGGLHAALRGEHLFDQHGYFSGSWSRLSTGTATLDYRSVPHMILRLEHRLENADEALYTVGEKFRRFWHSTILSLVVMSGGE